MTIAHSHLLAELFGQVLMPPSVKRELLRFHPTLPSFLSHGSPQNMEMHSRLSLELDSGEAEAICLSCELKADRLLIDEKRGRDVPLLEGLAIIGVIGVLLTAKQKGLIAS